MQSDKAWQFQFTRSLSKGVRSQCWYRARNVFLTALSVMPFVTQRKFFYDGQFRFRKKHGTNHAVTWLVERIAEAFENKYFILRVFFKSV